MVGLRTERNLRELSRYLKQLEREHGRTEALSKYSSQTLDIDILTYDNLQGLHHGVQLPRPEISYNAYVLRPLTELVPEMLLPGSDTRLADLWHNLVERLNENEGDDAQPLMKMPICW